MESVDVLIHGSGVVGRSLALCLGQLGLRVALRLPAADLHPDDVRAYALNRASVALLRELRVWDALPPHAVTPVYDMRIEGDAQAVLEFSAWQQGMGELAWIVDVPALEQALATAIQFSPRIQVLSAEVSLPQASLVAVCEGRHSALRDALEGVTVRRVSYGQTAIAARLSASLPHAGVARQWFRSPDVLALLPCAAGVSGGPAYALVWSLPTDRAAGLMTASESAFVAALAESLSAHPELGELKLVSKRASWPLVRMLVEPWCGPGWVLVGDAAHTVHPLAGQGLNLGLADVASLKQVLSQREPWRNLGDVKLLRRYERQRALHTRLMGGLTGALTHLFAHSHPWVGEARNRGLSVAQKFPGIKQWLTARAIG